MPKDLLKLETVAEAIKEHYSAPLQTDLDIGPTAFAYAVFYRSGTRECAIMKVYLSLNQAYQQLKRFLKPLPQAFILQCTLKGNTRCKFDLKDRQRLFDLIFINALKHRHYCVYELTYSMERYREVPWRELIKTYDPRLWRKLDVEESE